MVCGTRTMVSDLLKTMSPAPDCGYTNRNRSIRTLLAFAVYFMPNDSLVTENFREAFYIISGVAFVHFTVTTKLIIHQIVRRFNSYNHKTIRMQFDDHTTCYRFL